MARKKEPAPPLFSVRHQFQNSLEAVCNESIMLVQAVEMALRGRAVQAGAAEILKERVAAFRATLMSE